MAGADLKTTAEERAKIRRYGLGAYYSLPSSCTERLLDDLDTLLTENAKLRAVAEAAKAMQAAHAADDRYEAVMASKRMLVALAALEAP